MFGRLDIVVCQEEQRQVGGAPAGSPGGPPLPPVITFLDLPVSKTIHNLLVLAKSHPARRAELFGEATRIQKQFKVPDKRFWHVKVRSLAMSHQWDELRKFANERKSPVGYKPFAEQCVEQRLAPAEVAYYVDRMAVPEERYDIYMKINMWNRALEMAQKLKDAGKIMQIRTLCKDENVIRAVDHLMGNM
jgi:hypothetical protein